MHGGAQRAWLLGLVLVTTACRGTAVAPAPDASAPADASAATDNGASSSNDAGDASAPPLPCGSGIDYGCCSTSFTKQDCPTYDTGIVCGAFYPNVNPRHGPAPCEGFLMIETTGIEQGGAEIRLYDAVSHALVALGYERPSGQLDCMYGPSGFVIPQTCALAFDDPDGGEPCDPIDGDVFIATSVCLDDGGLQE